MSTGNKPGLFERWFGKASAEDKKEMRALLEDEGAETDASSSSKEQRKEPSAPPAPQADSQQNDKGEVERLRAKVEQLEQNQLAQLKSTLTTQAENFINGKILARTVLPNVKDKFVADFVQAGVDDKNMPLPEGKKRTDALIAHYEGKQAHTLTDEKTTATTTVLPDSEDGKKTMSDERRRELLSHTDAGRAVLAAKK